MTKEVMAYLVLVRHGESEWNAKDLWTGWSDIPLSGKGREEAKKAAVLIKGIKFDIGFTSKLKRAKETLDIIKREIQNSLPVIEDSALNEKNYGDFTGKNKWQVKKEVGDGQFLKIRRSWDYQIPNGESLKDVYQRTIPYYLKEILPKLKEGNNTIISAHNNSLRALIKYLENISDAEIPNLEMATGEVYIYNIDKNGKVISKEIKK